MRERVTVSHGKGQPFAVWMLPASHRASSSSMAHGYIRWEAGTPKKKRMIEPDLKKIDRYSILSHAASSTIFLCFAWSGIVVFSTFEPF